jgi:hypothetical protein
MCIISVTNIHIPFLFFCLGVALEILTRCLELSIKIKWRALHWKNVTIDLNKNTVTTFESKQVFTLQKLQRMAVLFCSMKFLRVIIMCDG